MTKHPTTERKSQLTGRLIDYLLAHGPSDLSLRPMAAAVGTSARLLIFHFGSKEELLLHVLREVELQLQRSLTAILEAPAGERRVAPIRALWTWAMKEENLQRMRLNYEIQILASRDSGVFAQAAKEGPRKMMNMVKAALPPPLHNAPGATLVCAVFDGLFLELMVTGDSRRTTRSLDLFVQMARGMIASGKTLS